MESKGLLETSSKFVFLYVFYLCITCFNGKCNESALTCNSLDGRAD